MVVDEWLFWQMAGFGPMLGQNNHFAHYAPEKIPYAIKRYSDETHRLYRVLNERLRGRDFVADDYSIADMAILDWSNAYPRYEIDLAEFPDFTRWNKAMNARPAVQRSQAIKLDVPGYNLATDKAAQAVMFNQR